MSSNQPLVSVYCMAYNHEKYIRDCLEGFIMQKTTFPFEVIVHDDASCDRTAEVIREFEIKYPEIIKPIYEEENQFQKNKFLLRDIIFPRVKGKYVAICEGDDYWTDENKLQDQVGLLENHPDCHFCVAGVEEVSLNKTPLHVYHPADRIDEQFISPDSFINYVDSYSFQTSSYMMRYDDWKDYILDPPEFRKSSDVGDLPMLLYFGSLGKTGYINRIMSCYRRGAVASYSAQRIKWSEEQRIAHWMKTIKTWKAFDSFSKGRFHDTCAKAVARPMFDMNIVTCNAKAFLKKENIPYFRALPFKKRVYVLAALLLKKTVRRLYRNKINKFEKRLSGAWH